MLVVVVFVVVVMSFRGYGGAVGGGKEAVGW